jgi:ABC-type polar amino acid transport system ATPase subunit
MSDPILRVEDLQTQFGELLVLRGVNLTVSRGEVVVIIGPSGVIIEQGPPQQIFTKAAHERTRRFLNQLQWDAN